MRTRLTLVALIGLAACADDSMGKQPPQIVPLTIWNSSQRPLEEVRVHDGTEYSTAVNELSAPLADDQRTVVNITAGQHVTVIRRNVDGGPRIAFTTASALNVYQSGFVLQVFQESFRLHEPDFQDGSPPDDGDGGDTDDDGGDTGDGDVGAAGGDGDP